MAPYFAAILVTVGLSLVAETVLGSEGRVVTSRRLNLRYIATFCMTTVTLVLILMAGLRWMVGTDYGQYERNYVEYRDGFLTSLITFDEPGIRLLAVAASWINDDPAMMFFLAAVITVGLALRTYLRNTDGPIAFVLSLYILSASWHTSFNAVRQALAISLIFAAHRYIMQRRFLAYSVVVALATSFHLSAAVAILLYWIPFRKIRISGVLWIVVGTAMSFLAAEQILRFVLEITGLGVTAYVLRTVDPVRVLIALAPLALYASYSPKSTDDSKTWFYRNLAVWHAAISVPFSTSAYLYRYTLYTMIFMPLALAALTEFKQPLLRQWARVGIILLFGVVWYYEVSQTPDLNPFKWIWDRP
ncbi:EpsG family protein [Tessaracoccus oleiagri]|uniref:EpsG family protein n=1 Tax=Tessaracoccus oleiagri TaxID=686624 RepID=A0A1G9N6E2_9ACTN|nr:EpsG family protein [Tessaracoccus oleiagri]SDL81851.1 EpsG family protein [Tessaracoccus oleiagri]